ncbi:histidine utilization repressor [Ensifer adhaerens]|uniref:histidine utilization repressor n=1 Tax=Ensifer adhaerens TaxID=106592 RepID=UPI001CBC79CB|nr:histidine utilization repressor [Ensifer adhaerens]MBZ7924916.1 histidine utilization repressor [Ensifer adhaerens]UAX95871.1 histidine utilization repressor [Ensifer adhaerens]UAY04787.1 histidine utilization repressor [Ensifer adhaerens]UAY10218.1 histidine utilization repressor [Ensifer adhaerens]
MPWIDIDPAVESSANRGKPLYERLKTEIRERVDSGEWPEHTRIPSENELVENFGVSRMTANRALRELAFEGLIVRIQGKGSYVAPKKKSAPFMEVRNIAEEIAERGSTHLSEIVVAQRAICSPELAESLGVEIGAPVFHSIIIHHEDDVPIQMEDRFVNPLVAPDYLAQDFNKSTPNAYLSAVAPITHTEQFVEAALPHPWQCKLMAISRSEPCLLVTRRTWSADQIVTSVRLLYPGSRYRFCSAF